ncbi:MAG TPA: MltA domain-containing protein [Roseiarcus sp.]|nr:MltA domain-containing protein [Roseiarcus sp.]
MGGSAGARGEDAILRPALTSARFDDLAGFAQDDHLDAFRAWRRSAQALLAGVRPTRPGAAIPPAFRDVARFALALDARDGEAARDFFITHFRPYRIHPDHGRESGFVTGYYEPLLRGALSPAPGYSAPVLGRPDDLVSFAPGETPPDLDPKLSGGRRGAGGRFEPYPDRAAIEAAAESGAMRPILWLEDHVELFLAQVQGSARVMLPDGRVARLAYDGRNGRPYTSIGRALIDGGAIKESEMSLAVLKAWLRRHGQGQGETGRKLMQRNRSYVFFKLEEDADPNEGPTGGAGIALTKLRSIAIDRRLWPYHAPFWIEARLPWRGPSPSAFRRLTIAQDTGSAILGAARADIFFGTGEEAGERAGDIRHDAAFAILLPVGAEL